MLSYQGVLTNADGSVVDDGLYTIRFSVHDAPQGGTQTFFQELQVSLRDGLYSVILSDHDAESLAAAFSAFPRYMEVAIVAPPSAALVFQPRQQIVSVPFALTAGTAQSLTAPPAASPIPAGAIILWDQSNTCPTGFAEALEFRKVTIRGADTAPTPASVAIPDSAGTSCGPYSAFNGDPTACGATNQFRYNDNMEIQELVSHSHTISHNTGTGSLMEFVSAGVTPATISTNNTGGDEAHYHPFRTVLFCRKQP
ncbi:MAG: hypothetical protein WEF50_03170 [Myxococcota bacterium]